MTDDFIGEAQLTEKQEAEYMKQIIEKPEKFESNDADWLRVIKFRNEVMKRADALSLKRDAFDMGVRAGYSDVLALLDSIWYSEKE
jgi:hypothetical protein